MGIKRLIPFLLFLFLPLLFIGSLGLVSQQECNNKYDILSNPGKLMNCYHRAALTSAHVGNRQQSVSICSDIRNIADPFTTGSNSDTIKEKARTVSNNCFSNIAEVLGDRTICNNIDTQNQIINLSVQRSLRGKCKIRANRTSDGFNLQQERDRIYRNSICATLFIPFLLLLYSSFRKRKDY